MNHEGAKDTNLDSVRSTVILLFRIINRPIFYLVRLRLCLASGFDSSCELAANWVFMGSSIFAGARQDPPAAPRVSSAAREAACGVALPQDFYEADCAGWVVSYCGVGLQGSWRY
jgi:hypothetical protein